MVWQKAKPKNWNLEEQLKNLQLPEAQKTIKEMTKKYTDIHNLYLKNKSKNKKINLFKTNLQKTKY